MLWSAWARTINTLRPGEPWDHVVIPRHRVRWDVLSTVSRERATVHQQVWDANLRAAAHYVTRPYPDRVTLIQSRQLDALARSRAHFDLGCRALTATRSGELLAEELRLAQQALGEITGELTSDDLLGRIFGEFCIGK